MAFRKLRKAVSAVLFVAAATLFVVAAFMDGDAIDNL
jgi:hypothetical protein